MGQHQDIIFAVKISQAESHPVVVIFAEIGIQLHVLQKIVHPAHVPLKGKAQSVLLGCFVTLGQAVDSSAIISTPRLRP